jgi:hypothetical protein
MLANSRLQPTAAEEHEPPRLKRNVSHTDREAPCWDLRCTVSCSPQLFSR